MWDGVVLPHSGHLFSLGARQRLAPRRMRDLDFEVRLFGTAMAVKECRLVEFQVV